VNLLVADAGAGIVQLRPSGGNLIVPLPGVSDMSPAGLGGMFAVTGGPPPGDQEAATLYWATRGGQLTEVADLLAFETAVNPDGGIIESNPFDVEALSIRKTLVADAAGNDLLVADRRGNVDWVAVLPPEVVSSQHLKDLAGCPNPPPGFEFICELPEMMPAEPVATSVAIGPDGAYYMGELKGFPAPVGESRIWRVAPDALHAQCDSSPACTVVADGFTSIVDLRFGPDGTLYVVELDEASWAAVEFGFGSVGGTVNACDPTTWTCTVVAANLPIPMAATVEQDGTVFVAINALIPGAAQVISLLR
jgi:hypothetical protein